MRPQIAPMILAASAIACAPDAMSPVGFSDDAPDEATPTARTQTLRPKEMLGPLVTFGKPIAARFWSEGHSYRRFTIEVWGNDIARSSTLSGGPAAVGSEFIAAHFADEKDGDPILFFAMRKEAQDGGSAWVYRAYDGDRQAMVLDPKPCEGCHAMARHDSRFTWPK